MVGALNISAVCIASVVRPVEPNPVVPSFRSGRLIQYTALLWSTLTLCL